MNQWFYLIHWNEQYDSMDHGNELIDRGNELKNTNVIFATDFHISNIKVRKNYKENFLTKWNVH